MKKAIPISFIFAILLVSVLWITPAFAMGEGPGQGPFSDLMLEAFVLEIQEDGSDLTVEDIQALRDSGMSFMDIAIDLGYEGEELTNLFDRVGETVLELAVQEGLITQDVSDKLSQRMEMISKIFQKLMGKFLEKLGLTQEELFTLLNSGMTLREILLQQGFEPRTNVATRCGLSREEILTRMRAGETLFEICPNLAPSNINPTYIQP